MLARLWLLLACALLLAPPSARPAEAGARRATVSAGAERALDERELAEREFAEREQPTIEADQDPYSSNVRASESAELLTVVARVLAVGARLPEATSRRQAPAWRVHRATGWCDVVQCRRWAGTELLRYATPPPARA